MIRQSWMLMCFAVLAVLLFANVTGGLLHDSFWLDEGWTAWTIHTDSRPPETLWDAVRQSKDNLLTMLERVQADVHPPLYFLLLDCWVWAAGESEFALRIPSALAGMLALAAVCAVGAQWFDRRSGLIAVLLLGTSGFFVYYAREARMYTLYLALATWATWAYERWHRKPTLQRGLLYGMLLTLAFYTHYVSALMIPVHVGHLFVTSRFRTSLTMLARFVLPFAWMALLVFPWFSIALGQWRSHPSGAAALFLASDWNTLSALWLLLTSGYWFNFILPMGLGRALPDILAQARTRQGIILLTLWLLLPAGGLLVLNARGFAVLQMRYLILIVPAWLLFIAYAIDRIQISRVIMHRAALADNGLRLFFALWLAYTQLSMFDNLWPPKPRWREAVALAAAARDPLEPAVFHIDPYSPVAYYHRASPVVDGLALNIGWRAFSPRAIRDAADHIGEVPSAWAILPMQAPSSWDVLAVLANERGIGYRDSVQGTIFYRFDEASSEPLTLQFGDAFLLRWFYQDSMRPSDGEVCLDLPLVPLLADSTTFTAELALVRGYDEVVGITTTANCLSVPPLDQALHLRLSVLGPDGRLPLVENGLYWGDYAYLGVLE